MSTLHQITQLTPITQLAELVREDRAALRAIGRDLDVAQQEIASTRRVDAGRADYLLLVLGLLLVAAGAALAVIGSFPG